MNGPSTRGTAVGAPVRRVDAVEKVTGSAVYVDDLHYPDALHAALVFPGCAHAELVGIDRSRALAMPGVRAVLTADDIPGENQVGVVQSDQPLLPHDRIRYEGDAVAVVVAESSEAAREAAESVSLTVRELPGVFDVLEATEDGAPLVHPEIAGTRGGASAARSDGNVFLHDRVIKGDIERGFAEADVIVERTFRTSHQEHCYLEPLGALAVPEGEHSITVYGTMQCPFYVQKAVATVLGLPLAAVRVVQTVTGGGFGGKEDVPSEVCACAALAAWRTGRPVKLVYRREEDFVRSSKRHPMAVTFKLGATRDGAFTAASVRAYADAGAYSTLSPVVVFRAAAHATGPYEVPNVETHVYGVYTNRQTTGAFRGFGQPQVIFAGESVIDETAQILGIDPVEIRLRNCLDAGRKTATGQILTESVGVRQTLEKARDLSGWEDERKAMRNEREATPRHSAHIRRGIGVASIYYGVSLGARGLALDGSGALVNVYRDGSVRASVGGAEMGQGLLTVLTQVLADGLGVRTDRIVFGPLDTAAVPDSGPSVASRTTLMSGNALLDAASKIKSAMGGVAADMLGVEPDALSFGGGRVGTDSASVAFEDVAAECWSRNVGTAAEGWYAAPLSTFDENGQGDAYAVYSYATHVAEVEVDTETGRVSLVRVTAVHDVGRALNPDTLDGQIQGGVLQGAGMALLEEMKTRGGSVLTPDFSTYVIPTSLDVPEIRTAFIEEPYSRGPYGAKGIGETPAMPGAAAVANAVADALGVRFRELPLVPERVLRGLSAREEE
jgi:CO/xanthine dehydrogenase Mo-binding subunit